ncbi:MAG: DUF4139 domain-containing protein [Treponema sp.]|nr:DUF4139 domain-containing protein [Treponema sp.]
MNLKKIRNFCAAVLLVLLAGTPVFAQPAFSAAPAATAATPMATDPQAAGLPLKRLALFSSGVGFFEHSGRISGTADSPFQISLPFSMDAVNDVLKSLAINDPVSDSPSVTYASSDTLSQTLKSLAVDLSDNPGMAQILNSLKGAEVTVSGASVPTLKGRIIGVEDRSAAAAANGYQIVNNSEPYLTLFTQSGINSAPLRDYDSFSFTDEKINADLQRALDLLLSSGDWNTRNLLVTLPGAGSRDVSLSYVIPAPVWKVSYRLDLAGSSPLLQGWAIVDNDSDSDWNNIELSLVTGRPVSFIQNLYAPYHTSRPVLPLSIAGIAESRTYDSGYGAASADGQVPESGSYLYRAAPMPAPSMALQSNDAASGGQFSLTGGTMQTASGTAAGDQFEFTFKQPVSIERRQSAMLPLVEGSIKADKTLVLSGSQMTQGSSINPAISAELTNTTGMKLPAGPITVYDDGTYAGDALIEFLPENEKRIISYGDDLTVNASLSSSGTRTVTSVTVSGGVMTINRRQDYVKTYSIRNSSGTDKKIIIEHPITPGTTLAEPGSFDERTANLYRFSSPLPANQETTLRVREVMPVSESITLSALRPDSFLSYSTNQEIPANVRDALSKAIDLRMRIDAATTVQQALESSRTDLYAEQDRIRQNIDAAGNQSPQGLDYLKRLAALDTDIDSINAQISAAQTDVQNAKQDYDNYIANINLK